jgi:dTDP-4-amino-4,6-dideoxygalactose transaminase
VTKNGQSILNYGDLSVLSFHATKVYSTIEGGAIISHTPEMKHRIDNLKNFGFRGETVIEEPGINGKLNEVQAGYGLLQLKYIDNYIERNKDITLLYRKLLRNIPGVSYMDDILGIRHNYSYFPILVDEKQYGMNRNELYEKLKKHNIYSRRYFYPLISNFEPYRDLPSVRKGHLYVASKAAEQVLCLPIYIKMRQADIYNICNLITKVNK